MIDLEARLRGDLRSVADQVADPRGLEERVNDLIDKRVRRVRVQRVSALVATAVLAVGAVAVAVTGGAGDGGVTDLANATPRSGSPGWATIVEAPISERFQHTTVSLDGEVLVFGGYRDGAAGGAAMYDPGSGRWRPVAGPPGDMRSSVATSTGSEALTLDSDGRLFSYDPEEDRWTERARSPFEQVGNAVTSVVWTGEALLALQANEDNAVTAVTVASYEPASDVWTELDNDTGDLDEFRNAAWTGDELVVVSAVGESGREFSHVEAMSFTPDGRWSKVPSPPLDRVESRSLGYSVWTGSELVVGGGVTWSAEAAALAAELVREDRSPTAEENDILEFSPALDAAAWNPATHTWRELPDAPVPTSGLERAPDLWTGREVVAWEMSFGDLYVETGRVVLLDPDTGTWRVSDLSPYGFHQEAPAVWTGREVVVFSGEPTSTDTDPSGCCTPERIGASFTP